MKTFQDHVKRAQEIWVQPEDFHHARTIQESIRLNLHLEALKSEWRYILGVDCAFPKGRNLCIAGAIRWSRTDGKVLEQSVSITPVQSPYVPGYLSFREIPGILEALRGIHGPVDVILVDGQGLCHPRWCGLATHLGILLDFPTIGVAKSRLYGLHDNLPEERGVWTPIWDKKYPIIIGAVVRTQARVKPVYVSIGNRILLHEAIHVILETAIRYRLPEPQRQADILVRKFSRSLSHQT